MGKTYRRDSDRKFKDFQKSKIKPKKLNNGPSPKFPKHLKPYLEDSDNADSES